MNWRERSDIKWIIVAAIIAAALVAVLIYVLA